MSDPTRIKHFDTTFRLGSTSYVYPDDILPNVQRLAQAGDVDDIELVLFEVEFVDMFRKVQEYHYP